LLYESKMISTSLFWISFLIILYTYAGYPLLLFFWAKLFPQKIIKSDSEEYPLVSVVIAVKNEELNIVPRLDNLLAQNYPQNKFEIILISDGSTDQTNILAQQFICDLNKDHPSIDLIVLKAPMGKPGALNRGVTCAHGEIIVFTDARQKFAPDAIRELVANFGDPEVGCVSGELYFLKNSESTIKEEMGLYWKIEKTIRKLESKIGSVVGATGAIYAIRKSLYRDLPLGTLLDDVLTPMNIVLQNYRTIFESNAHAFDVVSKDVTQEWRRKVRTLAGNWQLLNLKLQLFSPLHNPIWWRFLSHKIFRLLVPFCLPVVFICSMIPDGFFYSAATYAQLTFYGLALCGWMMPKARSSRFINLCYFFIVLNMAAVNGFIYWLTGSSSKAWKP